MGDRFLLFVVATAVDTRQNNRYNDAPGQSTQVVSEFPEYSTDSKNHSTFYSSS